MKILLLTGHFPPEKSGGIGRPFSLYKYLPDYEIEVLVVSKNLYGRFPDEKNVYRYDSFGNWRNAPLFSKKVLLKIISLFKNTIYGINYDPWWTNKVIKSVNDYNQSGEISLIYATFPGVEVLEAALKLKGKLKVPMIVEFRDGLAFETVLKNPNFLQRTVIKNLEKKIINASDAVITIGENLSKYFRLTYKKPVYTVYNGYEESDFSLIKNIENEQKSKKTVIHFGSLNSSRAAKRDGLFKALQHLKNNKIIDENNFSLLFIGNIKDEEVKEASKYGLHKIITFIPQMDKKEGFSFITRHADFLLFYGVPDQSTIISSKLLEYLKLNKPVIGICKGNEAALIIQKTGTGEVCDFDENSIESLLMKLINNEISYEPDHAEIEKFNRKYQAEEIAEIIKGIPITSK